MNKIIKAINFARIAHDGQNRKGKELSYISHPLSVALLLSDSGFKEDVVIAGILHDTIEDTDVSYQDIETKFEKNVADIVNDVSEKDKKLSWKERKHLALEKIPDMKEESVFVKTADVLHNMSEQLEDYKKEGDKMFEKFNAGKEAQLERYDKLVKTLRKRKINNPLLSDLENTFLEVKKLWS
jgi:(p)ppGpp synthase/HD superfamily hydrolase